MARIRRGFYSPACLVLAALSLVLLEIAAQVSQHEERAARGEGAAGSGSAAAAAAGLGATGAPRRLAASSGSGCQDQSAASTTTTTTVGHGGASHAGGHAEGHAADHTSRAFEPVTFFILAYLSSAAAQQVTALLPKRIRVPHSVCLYLAGLVIARISATHGRSTEFGRSIDSISHIDPHVIFWILLPALLYEDSAGVHWHVFKRVCPNALLLAVPGVIVNTVLTGIFVKVAFHNSEWTWSTALLLGSILSATDPVAVVSALHQLAAPDKLASLISGESLFNDGSAVVLFNLFWDLARGIREFELGYGVLFFLRMAVGGPLLALAVALVAHAWLRCTARFNIEILVILVSIYGLFFLAEHPSVQVSGVLAVVCFGSYMAASGRFALAIEAEHEHHAVMSFLGLLSNEAIFLIAGIVSYRFGVLGGPDGAHGITMRDYFECVALYFVIHFTRASVILLFLPLLRKCGYGLNWREATICVWGGLRGAVGLAMALLVEHDSRLDEATRLRIAFHTSGIVFGTLLVNGTTVTTLYKKLQIYSKAKHHNQLLEAALRRVDESVTRHAFRLREHWFFHNCHMDLVMRLLPLLSKTAEVGSQRTRSRSKITVGDVECIIDALSERLEQTQGEAELHIAEKILCHFRSRQKTINNCFLLDPSSCISDTDREEEFALAMRIVEGEESIDEVAELQKIHSLQLRLRIDCQFRQESKKQEAAPSLWRNLAVASAWTLKSKPGSRADAKVTPSLSRASSRHGTTATQGPTVAGNLLVEPPPDGAFSVLPAPSSPKSAKDDITDDAYSASDMSGVPLDEPVLSELAKRRWKWLSRRVPRAVHMMQQIREESGSKAQLYFMSKSKSKMEALDQCQQDEASMVEVYLTIINSARAAYKSMHRAQSLSIEPYRLLMESLDKQEEVVHLGAMKRSTTRASSFSNSTINSNNSATTRSGCQEAWDFLRSHFGQPTGFAFPLVVRAFRVENWLDAQWWLLKRDAEIITAYVMTQEHLMDGLDMLSRFPDSVQGPMKAITEEAKKQALFALVKKPYDSAMLALFEHVLLARLLVRMQSQLVQQLLKEGALLEEDAHGLISHIIRPTEQALFEFTPTPDQLQRIGSKSVSNYRTSRFKRLLMWLVRLTEFHDLAE